MKQKVSLLAVCAVLLSLFGAGCLAVVLDPGRKAEEQLAAAFPKLRLLPLMTSWRVPRRAKS